MIVVVVAVVVLLLLLLLAVVLVLLTAVAVAVVNSSKNIKNNKYQKDDTPLDANCKNFSLNKYSKNYLNHLFNTNEILASMLLTLHNINFYQELMESIREHIKNGTFNDFHDKYIDKL